MQEWSNTCFKKVTDGSEKGGLDWTEDETIRKCLKWSTWLRMAWTVDVQ